MRVVLGIHSLAGNGGTESYVTTVGDHLQRSGHEVWVYSAEDGVVGDAARLLGLRVVTRPESLPEAITAFLVQDSIAALELFALRPEVPQIFVWHSELFDVQVPPQLEGVTTRIVTLYADARRRLDGLAVRAPVVELSHPVDSDRFKPATPLREHPRALTMSNYLVGERLTLLEGACAEVGIELRTAGGWSQNGLTSRPEAAFNGADIVFAKGKTAIEAMACGRAVFVYDVFGADGWVTRESYPDLEKKCFGGNLARVEVTHQDLVRELEKYDPAMGLVNRDLALSKHSAIAHCGQIAQVIRDVAGERDEGEGRRQDGLFEMARLARVNWRHESRAFFASAALHVSEVKVGELVSQLHQVKTEEAGLRKRADDLQFALQTVTGSRRWRVLNLLLKPLDLLRGRA